MQGRWRKVQIYMKNVDNIVCNLIFQKRNDTSLRDWGTLTNKSLHNWGIYDQRVKRASSQKMELCTIFSLYFCPVVDLHEPFWSCKYGRNSFLVSFWVTKVSHLKKGHMSFWSKHLNCGQVLHQASRQKDNDVWFLAELPSHLIVYASLLQIDILLMVSRCCKPSFMQWLPS